MDDRWSAGPAGPAGSFDLLPGSLAGLGGWRKRQWQAPGTGFQVTVTSPLAASPTRSHGAADSESESVAGRLQLGVRLRLAQRPRLRRRAIHHTVKSVPVNIQVRVASGPRHRDWQNVGPSGWTCQCQRQADLILWWPGFAEAQIKDFELDQNLNLYFPGR